MKDVECLGSSALEEQFDLRADEVDPAYHSLSPIEEQVCWEMVIEPVEALNFLPEILLVFLKTEELSFRLLHLLLAFFLNFLKSRCHRPFMSIH